MGSVTTLRILWKSGAAAFLASLGTILIAPLR